MKKKQLNISHEDLDIRLNCFGEFNDRDLICLNLCALSINCAIAKNKFLGFHLLEEPSLGFDNADTFEAE